MTRHDQLNRPCPWTLVLGAAAGLLLGRPALAHVPLPSPLVPLAKFSITRKASGSGTYQTSTADYTAKFTLPPDRVLDPPAASA